MSTRSTRTSVRTYRQRQRRQLKAIGEWQDPQVDAAPVRERVLVCRQMGMSLSALVNRLGLPPKALHNVMYGANGRPPGKTVLRETAEAVLGFWPTLEDFPDSALIHPAGTVRRVRALQVRGFDDRWQAAELGLLPSNFRAALRSSTVSARFARRVAGLYDRMWDQRPEGHDVTSEVAERARAFAAEQCYSGPLAWDDDTIDDPSAVPQTDAVAPVATEGGNVAARWLMGESVVLDRDARREVLAHLYEWTNDTTAEIAEQLDMSPAATERAWERMKERSAAEGRRLWRRVYVPRERDLKQTEMEEAA